MCTYHQPEVHHPFPRSPPTHAAIPAKDGERRIEGPVYLQISQRPQVCTRRAKAPQGHATRIRLKNPFIRKFNKDLRSAPGGPKIRKDMPPEWNEDEWEKETSLKNAINNKVAASYRSTGVVLTFAKDTTSIGVSTRLGTMTTRTRGSSRFSRWCVAT